MLGLHLDPAHLVETALEHLPDGLGPVVGGRDRPRQDGPPSGPGRHVRHQVPARRQVAGEVGSIQQAREVELVEVSRGRGDGMEGRVHPQPVHLVGLGHRRAAYDDQPGPPDPRRILRHHDEDRQVVR